MSKVIALMSMSLDGFVADPDDGVDELFDWYFAGDVAVPTPSTTSDFTFRASAPSADHLRNLMAEVGAMLTGRRTFERADELGRPAPVEGARLRRHPPRAGRLAARRLDGPLRDDGLESAVARAKEAAGPRPVGVHGARTIQQLLNLGLLDEIHVDLAAVLMGAGVRLFDNLASAPVVLGDPTVVAGVGVTHLRYPVRTA